MSKKSILQANSKETFLHKHLPFNMKIFKFDYSNKAYLKMDKINL